MMIEIDVNTEKLGTYSRVHVEFLRGFEQSALDALDAAYKEAHDRISNASG